jgi:hypothetical protein
MREIRAADPGLDDCVKHGLPQGLLQSGIMPSSIHGQPEHLARDPATTDTAVLLRTRALVWPDSITLPPILFQPGAASAIPDIFPDGSVFNNHHGVLAVAGLGISAPHNMDAWHEVVLHGIAQVAPDPRHPAYLGITLPLPGPYQTISRVELLACCI